MGKLPTALLSIVFQLYLIEAVFADSQVRRVQEELRRRHLFYGEITGEVTPALTAAITRYQEKKGFARTGRLDLQTCASLGVAKAPVKPTPTVTPPPFVFADSGDVRGPNGEALPNSVLAYQTSDQSDADLASVVDMVQVALASAGDDAATRLQDRHSSNAPSHTRPRRVQPRKETNPFVLAFRSVDHAMKVLVGDTQPKRKRTATSRL